MISKVISISEKVNGLSLFGRLLYTWMIPHTDDFGRMTGSPAKVRALVVPMADETTSDVEQALQDMENRGLIQWYEVDGERFVQIINFDEHQQGLHRRSPSKIPAPQSQQTHDVPDEPSNQGKLSALEKDIEEMIEIQLSESHRFITVDRQVRIENSYLDIIATDATGKYLFEIKRQRLSNSALEQIIRYRELLNDKSIKCYLIGYGLSANFDVEKAEEERVNVVVYDDNLNFEHVTLIDVNYRELTSLARKELELELNRTRTESTTTTTTAREVFRVFEREGFGTISTLLVDDINDAVETYSELWVIKAMKEAASVNKRNWKYALAILKRWKSEGIDSPWERNDSHAKSRASPTRSRGEYDFLSH